MSDIDVMSPTWRAVAGWAEKQIEIQRGLCEKPGLPHDETERARGALQSLRGLLRQGEDKRPLIPRQPEAVGRPVHV